MGKLLAEKECCGFDNLKKLRYTFEDSANYTAIIKSNDEELKMALKKVNDTISEINSSFGVSSTKVIKKSTKVFSIISGILFILSAVLYGYYMYSKLISYQISDLLDTFYMENLLWCIYDIAAPVLLLLLGIFSLKKQKRGIKIIWLLLAVIMFIPFAVYPCLANIITPIIYLMYMLIDCFQEKIFVKQIFCWLIFILPIVYAIYVVFNYMSIYNLCIFLGMIFHALYLVSANKKSKRI